MEKDRWDWLWKRLGARGDRDGTFAALEARYGESLRVYHTLAHVGHCLDVFAAGSHLAHDPSAVETAIWFHDAVYEPLSGDNEARSAEFARDVLLNRMGLAPAFADKVADLVLATAHDRSSPKDIDEQLLVDIDLAILGAPWAEFEAYDLAVRTEFEMAGAEEDAFNEGRAELLRSFLSRKDIYLTRFFKLRYEGQARSNIRRAIDALEA